MAQNDTSIPSYRFYGEKIESNVNPISKLVYRVLEMRGMRIAARSENPDDVRFLSSYYRIPNSLLEKLAASPDSIVRHVVKYRTLESMDPLAKPSAAQRKHQRIHKIACDTDAKAADKIAAQAASKDLCISWISTLNEPKHLLDMAMMRIVGHPDEIVRCRAAADPGLPVNMQRYMMQNSYVPTNSLGLAADALSLLAGNSSTHPDVLKEMVLKYKNAHEIRKCAARNPNIDHDTMMELAKDKDFVIRFNLITNPSLTPDVLKYLASEKNEPSQFVRKEADSRLKDLEMPGSEEKGQKKDTGEKASVTFSDTERRTIIGNEFAKILEEWATRVDKDKSAPAQDIHGNLFEKENYIITNMLLETRHDWLPVFLSRDDMDTLGIKPYFGVDTVRLLDRELSSGDVVYKTMFNIADTNIERVMPEEYAAIKEHFSRLAESGEYRNQSIADDTNVSIFNKYEKEFVDVSMNRTVTPERLESERNLATVVSRFYLRSLYGFPNTGETYGNCTAHAFDRDNENHAYETLRAFGTAVRKLNERYEIAPKAGMDVQSFVENIRAGRRLREEMAAAQKRALQSGASKGHGVSH